MEIFNTATYWLSIILILVLCNVSIPPKILHPISFVTCLLVKCTAIVLARAQSLVIRFTEKIHVSHAVLSGENRTLILILGYLQRTTTILSVHLQLFVAKLEKRLQISCSPLNNIENAHLVNLFVLYLQKYTTIVFARVHSLIFRILERLNFLLGLEKSVHIKEEQKEKILQEKTTSYFDKETQTNNSREVVCHQTTQTNQINNALVPSKSTVYLVPPPTLCWRRRMWSPYDTLRVPFGCNVSTPYELTESDSVNWRADSKCPWGRVSGKNIRPPLMYPEINIRNPLPLSRNHCNCKNNDNFNNFIEIINIRQIQKNQVNRLRASGRFLSSRDTRCRLIIGVDARPAFISGYCLNLGMKLCQFYTFSSDGIPWKGEKGVNSNSCEFEMKNMMFSLLLWEKEILNAHNFVIYTDNNSINTRDCEFGVAVTKFLEHFTGCENVVRVNSNTHINKRRDSEMFAKFIKPADDLSHWDFNAFKNYMRNMYGNIQFVGSHEISSLNNPSDCYTRSEHYDNMLQQVVNTARKWTIPCAICGFCFPTKDHISRKSDAWLSNLSPFKKTATTAYPSQIFSRGRKRFYSPSVEDFPPL